MGLADLPRGASTASECTASVYVVFAIQLCLGAEKIKGARNCETKCDRSALTQSLVASSHLIHLSKDLNSKFFFITSQSIYYLNIDLERILKRHLVKKSFLKASLKF